MVDILYSIYGQGMDGREGTVVLSAALMLSSVFFLAPSPHTEIRLSSSHKVSRSRVWCKNKMPISLINIREPTADVHMDLMGNEKI